MILYHGTNQDFGDIDLPTLLHNLRNMRGITFQYFFGTERAIKILKRL